MIQGPLLIDTLAQAQTNSLPAPNCWSRWSRAAKFFLANLRTVVAPSKAPLVLGFRGGAFWARRVCAGALPGAGSCSQPWLTSR